MTEYHILIGQNRSYDYPQKHLSFIENIHVHAKYEESSHVLDIPNIDVESLNQEQLIIMTYSIVLKTTSIYKQ